jgi:hypothetical protein
MKKKIVFYWFQLKFEGISIFKPFNQKKNKKIKTKKQIDMQLSLHSDWLNTKNSIPLLWKSNTKNQKKKFINSVVMFPHRISTINS